MRRARLNPMKPIVKKELEKSRAEIERWIKVDMLRINEYQLLAHDLGRELSDNPPGFMSDSLKEELLWIAQELKSSGKTAKAKALLEYVESRKAGVPYENKPVKARKQSK